MSRELINRITRKKDGIYISTHSSNDDAPYHSVKIDSLTKVYEQEGQKGLDREIINMLFNYAELRGSHHSLQKYMYAYNSKYANNLYKEYINKVNHYYKKLNEEDKKSLWSSNKTKNAESYYLYNKKLEKEMYEKIANKCNEYGLINKKILNNQNNKSFSYYENIIDKILDVSEEYNIDYDSNCPFESFGSDDESQYYETYSFSKFYKNILGKNNIEVNDITTIIKSSGKYIITIDNKYEFEIKTWDNLEAVIDNVDSMIDLLKEKKLEMEAYNYE